MWQQRLLQQAVLPPSLQGSQQAQGWPGVPTVPRPKPRVCGEPEQSPPCPELVPPAPGRVTAPWCSSADHGQAVVPSAPPPGEGHLPQHPPSRSERSRFGAFQAFPAPTAHKCVSTGSDHRHGNPGVSWLCRGTGQRELIPVGRGWIQPVRTLPPLLLEVNIPINMG